jgi:hypothetical protein
MIPVETDEELDDLLVSLGQPAGAEPLTSPDRILAMAAPPPVSVVKVGVSKWVLMGAVAASLFAGFIGGAVSSRLVPPPPPVADRAPGSVETSSSAPVVPVDPSASDAPVVAGGDLLVSAVSPRAETGRRSSGSSALSRQRGMPSGPVADVPGTESPGNTSTPGTDAVVYADPHFGRSPSGTRGADTASWGTPSEESLPGVPLPDFDERKRPRKVRSEDEVAVRGRSGRSPFALAFDLGGRSFPAAGPAERGGSLGLQTGVAARYDGGKRLVRPAVEAGVGFAAPLVPVVVAPALVPNVVAELGLALGAATPSVGWGLQAVVPFDGREPGGFADRVATGPRVGLDVGRMDRAHLRLRLDSNVPLARLSEPLHPGFTLSAGVEVPLGTM